ncbi:MAG: ATP-binding cassette domain-containing protein [Deltaproteobacteria bacterium]|nr:ATP-binding cassette domain-containing protein [Deltaproteobacteria bacterium]
MLKQENSITPGQIGPVTGNDSTRRVVLRVEDLRTHFFTGEGVVKAVDGVTFSLCENETLGLVGESGCGKTTVARLILLLDKPTSGSILFEGNDVLKFSDEKLKQYSRSVQAVFQDPYGSLDPRMRVMDIISEPLVVTHALSRKAVVERVKEVLEEVGLDPKGSRRFPHQFSGGQRQRIAVARALASNPRVIILDEPVSALDVSIRAQLMNLLKGLQERFGLTYLLIAHDLAVVQHMSNFIGVMYVGHIVEYGSADEVYQHPCHPYTAGLLSAALPADPDAPSTAAIIGGEVPSPMNPPPGCRFHPRCRHARQVCSEIEPQLREVAADHFVACHFDLGD